MKYISFMKNNILSALAVTVYDGNDIHVYDGYIIKYRGKVNGIQSDMEASIILGS